MRSGEVKLHLLDPFASQHHGLVPRWKSAELGISERSWYRAVDSGVLDLVMPNVARMRGSAPTEEQRILAAVWSVGRDAMSSHRTSARLWGAARPPEDPFDVLLPRRGRAASRDNVIIHRPTDRLDLRPIMRSGIPTTNPMRMLLDLGAVDPDSVHDTLLHVLSTRAASPAAIRGALVRHAKKGRHGVTALRQALERWLEEELPPDSVLEGRMAELRISHALPEMEFHAMLVGYEVDFLITGTRLVIECDGWGSHGLDRDQFEFDRLREADLTGAGYVVIRVTWNQLTKDPAGTARRILANVAQWAPHLLTEPATRRDS